MTDRFHKEGRRLLCCPYLLNYPLVHGMEPTSLAISASTCSTSSTASTTTSSTSATTSVSTAPASTMVSASVSLSTSAASMSSPASKPVSTSMSSPASKPASASIDNLSIHSPSIHNGFRICLPKHIGSLHVLAGVKASLGIHVLASIKASLGIHGDQRVVKDPSPHGPGPWGGDGGKPWDDGVFIGIKQIILTSSQAICSIEIEYDRNGQSVWSVKHGGNGGHTSHKIKLEYPNEVLTCISGFYGPISREEGMKVKDCTYIRFNLKVLTRSSNVHAKTPQTPI
ncbi:hypothetical protein RJ640_026046 [Escallonia rubra]|uniref:Jacalin-type lectin domain-containing protein n=1 Tax=Escallonia rubra TaxID=112253 RepID=A0AA88R7T5_9ASTE|nr:hypothetical protein RJ640_026046 [Escallonia rubra]